MLWKALADRCICFIAACNSPWAESSTLHQEPDLRTWIRLDQSHINVVGKRGLPHKSIES